MDRQTFTIGCLSVSALMLFCMVLVMSQLELQKAQASDMLSTAGSYTLYTGKLNPTNDLVYLIDTNTEKLAVYFLNETSRKLELTQVLGLDDPSPQKDARSSGSSLDAVLL